MQKPTRLMKNHEWNQQLMNGLCDAAGICSKSYFKEMVLRLAEALEIEL
jgi:hypothetical protein